MLTGLSDEYAGAFAIRRLPQWLVGGLGRELRLHRTAPQGCLLKERSGTDPIMKTHHEADQITGRSGTPTFEIKDCPLHAQLVLVCYSPDAPLSFPLSPDPVIVSNSYKVMNVM